MREQLKKYSVLFFFTVIMTFLCSCNFTMPNILAHLNQQSEPAEIFASADQIAPVLYDIDLYDHVLKMKGEVQFDIKEKIEGYFLWTVISSSKYTVGDQGKVYVKGSFNPETRKIRLIGNRQDFNDAFIDPVTIYDLELAADGRTLFGVADNSERIYTTAEQRKIVEKKAAPVRELAQRRLRQWAEDRAETMRRRTERRQQASAQSGSGELNLNCNDLGSGGAWKYCTAGGGRRSCGGLEENKLARDICISGSSVLWGPDYHSASYDYLRFFFSGHSISDAKGFGVNQDRAEKLISASDQVKMDFIIYHLLGVRFD